MSAFSVVEDFERAVSDFTGAPYCIAVASGTWAIFLSLVLERERIGRCNVFCPARTFISVPMAIEQAGFRLRLDDRKWYGAYRLNPTRVIDSALRFRPAMYERGTLTCLSFHARKIINIGEGGAVLTDDLGVADWLREARYSGRRAPDYRVEDVSRRGWQAYMTPEKAARGLHLMTYVRDIREELPDQAMQYPDLREAPYFKHER